MYARGNGMESSADSRDEHEVQPGQDPADSPGELSRLDILNLTRAVRSLSVEISSLNKKLAESPPVQRDRDKVGIGNLELDHRRHQVVIDREDVDLSAGEFRLMDALVSAYPEVVCFDELHRAYHGDSDSSDRNLRVYIRRLRLKLNGGRAKWNGRILNVRSIGYRIVGP